VTPVEIEMMIMVEDYALARSRARWRGALKRAGLVSRDSSRW
jgi:hypothetical protein